MKIIFKNLEKSELAKEAVTEKIGSVLDKFSDYKPQQVRVTLSMDNSPTQAGPDLFKVKFHLRLGREKHIFLERQADNLYSALADLAERLHERLIRVDEKKRTQSRSKNRKHKTKNPAIEHYFERSTA